MHAASYRARASGSERTACASLSAWNFTVASGAFGCRSGCSSFQSPVGSLDVLCRSVCRQPENAVVVLDVRMCSHAHPTALLLSYGRRKLKPMLRERL